MATVTQAERAARAKAATERRASRVLVDGRTGAVLNRQVDAQAQAALTAARQATGAARQAAKAAKAAGDQNAYTAAVQQVAGAAQQGRSILAAVAATPVTEMAATPVIGRVKDPTTGRVVHVDPTTGQIVRIQGQAAVPTATPAATPGILDSLASALGLTSQTPSYAPPGYTDPNAGPLDSVLSGDIAGIPTWMLLAGGVALILFLRRRR